MTQKEIIIEKLNSFCSKSEDSSVNEEREKYLNTSTTNEFKQTYLSDRYRDFENCNYGIFNHLVPPKMLTCKNFSEVNLITRNKTVKNLISHQNLEKKKDYQNKNQDFKKTFDGNIKTKPKNGNKHRRRKRKGTNKKKYRELSIGNQIMYKGRRGFDLIKKYRHKRRIESCKYREESIGNRNFNRSRSRNGSQDQFYETYQSCSSEYRSQSRSKSSKRSKTGLYTRNKLNEKYKAITEAKKLRMQNTLNKVMRTHENHAEPHNFSRK